MDILLGAVLLVAGLGIGIVLVSWLRKGQVSQARDMAQRLIQEADAAREKSVHSVVEQVKNSFSDLSITALKQSSDEFLKLAKATLSEDRTAASRELTGKKELIDRQLEEMTARLEKLSTLTEQLDKERAEHYGKLANQLQATGEQTAALMQTTNSLREALASSRTRGQWGERMAEDVLRLAGFVENVNYRKQASLDGEGTRPDFTFFLPHDLILNMDVKFPLDNYLQFLETESAADRERFRTNFLRDVKARIKEITKRGYIDPLNNTVDYVLMFIPNEQVYAFINEQDPTILDDALRNRVIACSPLTLFAVLAVIRQAVDNFNLQQTSDQILSLLGGIRKQWDLFVGKMDDVGKALGRAQKEYDVLTSTRQRALDKPLREVDELRSRKGLPVNLPELPDTVDEEAGDDQSVAER